MRSPIRSLPVVVVLGFLSWAAPALAQEAEQVACTDCHDTVDAAEFEATVHGGFACADCHTRAEEVPHPEGVAAVDCASCHSDAVDALARSVHARPVFTEISGKPACQTCHGPVHKLVGQDDPKSLVNAGHVAQTCAQCHGDIAKAFAASVHGQAATRGVREAPVCTDCHGEHRILGPGDPDSPVFASNVPRMTCGRCHGDLRVSDKFGMAPGVVASFEDSFHGLAGRSGNQTVANCASCHGVHNILPSADPRSLVNKANLARTCGNCHPGAGTRFALGPVHITPQEKQHAAVYWVRLIYLWIIWLTIGGMLLHNVLDMRRKVLSPIPQAIVPMAQRRPRMGLGFRIAHGLTMASFIVLAYTGFALKFPEGWWARPLLAWEEQLALRGWLHRGAAIVMMAAFLGHFVHLALSRPARACIRRMWPNRHDLTELRERLAWYFGKRAEMPRSPSLSYVEKAEYLALMWGTGVMAVTGFLLWFENFTLRWMPKWVIDISTVVHFYEAVLATLAILVWHFYFVIFDPLVYPMDTAWLTGREVPGRTLERTEAPSD